MNINQFCPTCGDTLHYVEYSGRFHNISNGKVNNFNVLSCTICGLSRTDPPPYEDDVTAEIYQDFSFNDAYKNPKLWESFFTQMFKYANKYKPNGKVLDIGCGSGFFINLARQKGYDTYGVELNKDAVNYGKNELNLNIVNLDLESANFPSNFFDVVTCSQLLEHIAKPNDILLEINRILKKDGILMLEVPNFNGLLVKFWKDKWSGFQPQWHIWQFKPKSLEKLLNKNQFEAIHIVCNQNIYTGQPINFYKRFIRNTIYVLIEAFASIINRSDKLLIVAKKK
ncbi:class I SAM-dependent methyltransferase [Aquirufa sp.]|jgi:2-polyprenyl-3-methyl-5-hydroxy-6-metoxy-1,4-benzoquinol methylase|uniref:class I SAM-dependent methyltransferase n=1 Tax=Aquirufa sp. TaxID=2676249 RepID=UPI003783F688